MSNGKPVSVTFRCHGAWEEWHAVVGEDVTEEDIINDPSIVFENGWVEETGNKSMDLHEVNFEEVPEANQETMG